MTEFQLIERFFKPLGAVKHPFLVQGNGDDCAVIKPPPGKTLCFSIDTQLEGVHFPKAAPPERLAQRALAAAMSDLAAMGAVPAFFTLALTLPDINESWLESFCEGLRVLVNEYQFPLVGGDTTKGPLTISIQVHGWLDQPPLLRSGAREGDIVGVSGTLGDAGAALAFLDRAVQGLSADERYLLDRYYSPSPRIHIGQALMPLASACIDISDGLLAEAGHIAESSSVAIYLDSARLPLSPALVNLIEAQRAQKLALSAGDDYELLFTLSPDRWDQLVSAVPSIRLSRIGSVQRGEGVFLDGKKIETSSGGYCHFD